MTDKKHLQIIWYAVFFFGCLSVIAFLLLYQSNERRKLFSGPPEPANYQDITIISPE